MTEKISELTLLEATLERATSESSRNDIIQACDALIQFHLRVNGIKECVQYSTILIPLLQEPEDRELLAKRVLFVGRCHSTLVNPTDAEEYFRKALKLYQLLGQELGCAEVNLEIARLYRDMGDLGTSLSFLQEAFQIYEKNTALLKVEQHKPDLIHYIAALELAGIINGQSHQQTLAQDYLLKALKLKRQYCAPREVISLLLNIGVTYSETDLNRTLEYYNEALALIDDSSPLFMKGIVLSNIGGCYEDMEDYPVALEYYERALQHLEKLKLHKHKSQFLKNIGTCYLKMNKFEEAHHYINKSLELFIEENAQIEIQDCYKLLSDIHVAKKDFENALDFRIKSDALKDRIFNDKLTKQLTDLQSKFEDTSRSLNQLKRENSLVTEALKKSMNMSFIGVSQSIKAVHELATTASSLCNTRVLITGESGVGKEIVARLIHFTGKCQVGRFVDVNCSSIPESLAESEFFGYNKGAFTGAVAPKIGYIEDANQGTLFLDEVADMPLTLQAKLLRILETKEVKRLGSNKSQKVDFRLISATNKDIPEMLQSNLFRADLLYRINTIEIHIPPLRDRKEDIEPLLEHFLVEYAKILRKPVPHYDSSLLHWLQDYNFPGNVRELKNMIERAMIFLKGDKLNAEDFLFTDVKPMASSQSCNYAVELNLSDVEDKLLLKALENNNGNQTLAAKALGISYSTFQRKYKRLRGSV